MNLKKSSKRKAKFTGFKLPEADHILYDTTIIKEYAENATVPRSYTTRYGLTNNSIAFESVSAHTNLMVAILKRAYSYVYKNSYLAYTSDNERMAVILEAAQRHDLPENVIGDIPDNGKYDHKDKIRKERFYNGIFKINYPIHDQVFAEEVDNLLKKLENVNEKSTEAPKMLYCADKSAAIIMALEYDSIKMSPFKHIKDEDLGSVEDKIIKSCENVIKEQGNTKYRASEMWTLDWIRGREIIKLDETGFFTSIIIMMTLMVHDKWYDWRFRDYSYWSAAKK